MQKVKADVAVETKNGVVTRVGRSVIMQPKVNFGGGSIKWLPERYKTSHKKGR